MKARVESFGLIKFGATGQRTGLSIISIFGEIKSEHLRIIDRKEQGVTSPSSFLFAFEKEAKLGKVTGRRGCGL